MSAKMTVVFNNIEGDKRLKTGWGSSILVELDKEFILFDTGPSAEDLFYNLNILGIDIRNIRKIAISHSHRDHRGALERVLRENPENIELYDEVEKRKEIAKDIFVFPIKGISAKENILVIKSPRGLILLTGCAHPGIYRICRTIKDDFDKNIYASFGGFHLEYYPAIFVKILGRLLKNLNIEIIGPNHCTGEKAIKILRQVFKDKFIDFGCGRAFSL